jgi:hypothetical protein
VEDLDNGKRIVEVFGKITVPEEEETNRKSIYD